MTREKLAQIMLDDLMKAPRAGGEHGCTFKFAPKHLDNVCVSGHIDLLALADSILAAQQDGAREAAAVEFVKWALQEGSWQGCDLDGGSVQDKLESLGLIVKEQYDPEKHGPSSEAEPGEDWYVYSPLLQGHEQDVRK